MKMEQKVSDVSAEKWKRRGNAELKRKFLRGKKSGNGMAFSRLPAELPHRTEFPFPANMILSILAWLSWLCLA
jgi:hypothetical protein